MLDLNAIPVTIAPGGTISTVGKLGVQVLVGIVFPASWIAAAVTFQVSPVNDGVNFFPLWDEQGAAALSIPATVALPGNFVAISNFDQWAAVNMLKLVSGATQTAGATITLLVRTVSL